MNLNEYQARALETAVYKKPIPGLPLYPALGLAGEAGEVAEKVKKGMRDDHFDPHLTAKEVGDVLWYVAVIAYDLGYTLDQIAKINLEKLKLRKELDLIKGSGDTREEVASK